MPAYLVTAAPLWSVIDTATNAVTATVGVGTKPIGVAVNDVPEGSGSG